MRIFWISFIKMDPVLALEVSSLAQMRDIVAAESRGVSSIQRVYSRGTALVTGGAGFLGKQLVQKLTRSTEIEKVYLLLRSKKGKTPKQRLDDILQDPLFDEIRKSKPDFSSKLIPIEGDITELGLGISDHDRKMMAKEVNFIFHGAATTRFDESLASATITNVRGTREVLAFGKICQSLRAFVHISTAFTHATLSRRNKSVCEQIYDVPIAPNVLIEMVENKDERGLEDVTKMMLQDWPNTYCFTKALAEEVVNTLSAGMPACIVRPAIVISAYRDPTPGWVDTSAAYGPAGVMIGIGLGLIHTVLAEREVKIDVMPADYVNNAILSAGWATAEDPSQLKIYTVSNNRNATTWGACSDFHRTESRKISTPKAVWYCYCFETSSKLVFTLLFWLLHYIPAYIIDGVCLLIGKQRQFVKLYTKVYKLFTLNSYFTRNEWKFSDNNLQSLYKSMSETDRQIYNFDVCSIDWKEFMMTWCLGLRKYIIKDGLKDTEYAVKKQFWFRIANFIFLALYAYLWWKLFTIIFSTVQYVF